MLKPLLSWIFGPHMFEVAALFVAAAGLAMALSPSRANVQASHWFFGTAFLMLLGRVVHWLVTTGNLPYPKPLIGAILFALVGGGWMIVYQWVEKQIQELSPPTIAVSQPSTSVAAFSAEVRSAFVSDSGPLTLFMVGYPSMFGSTASPVLYLAYVQIANLQDVPSTISDLKIAASKEQEGPWEDLVPIPLPSSTLYSLGIPTPFPKNLIMVHGTSRLAIAMTKEDMKLAAVVQALPALESEIANPIPARGTICGWVALDSLRHTGLTPGQIYFRIKLRDAANNGGTYVAELPRKQPGDSSVNVNNGVIQVVGIRTDISGFHVKYYGDPFPTPERY